MKNTIDPHQVDRLAVTMFAGHYDDPSSAIGWMPDRLLVEYIIDALIPVTKGGE